ncbi:peptidase M23-like protein [Sphingomonas sp. PP-F2F-G114-C0414]|uniref:M23 family metallopeptidase n=1 Tax=Sphingomonas sp. PP-F2F-G114-C0414 TaxID=2135662 RepID=UPI000EF898A9|nr:M23 family metallopeptidase [Sphingomonas sp. PP-F2F-G114-C0414]RMB35599.1 peptidase M23-like protein [Sphingomonas sp. PP-F2F-G114-C0414]
MNDSDDDDLSFDPRSWDIGRPTAPPVPPPRSTPQSPSFDPRSWGKSDPRPAPEQQPTPLSPAPAHAFPKAVAQFAPAILAGFAIASGGAVWAMLDRQPAPGPQSVAATTAPANPTAVAASRRILTVAGADAIGPSLVAAGVDATEANDAATRARGPLGAGSDDVRLVFDIESGHLIHLDATREDGAGIALARGAGGFTQQILSAHLVQRLTIVRGELDARDFYSAAVAAGINDTLVSDFANAFAFDFDLQREVAPGDIFEAGFEQRYNAAGNPVGVPVLVYASLETAAKSRALYRFAPPGQKGAPGQKDATGPKWYDANGRSTVRTLMRTPIDGARISSPFGMREHPVLGFMKLHRGTDFAAPTGTPIFASGDAVVEFAGLKGPNGNFVKLRHDNGWETLYLHMNRILPGIIAGARVVQGRQIGEVGTTGRSTGPHLHYEVHIDGQPTDPLALQMGKSSETLTGAALKAFDALRDRVDARRSAAN